MSINVEMMGTALIVQMVAVSDVTETASDPDIPDETPPRKRSWPTTSRRAQNLTHFDKYDIRGYGQRSARRVSWQ
jgi:hypothetical protein